MHKILHNNDRGKQGTFKVRDPDDKIDSPQLSHLHQKGSLRINVLVPA